MSYEKERRLIVNHIHRNNDFGFDNFAVDNAPIEVSHNSGFITILNGSANLASIGGLKRDYVGVLSIIFFMEGGCDSKESREKADLISDVFTTDVIDEEGTYRFVSSKLSDTSVDDDLVIDFAANGAIPYISDLTSEAPYIRTVVNCPFLRSQLNSS